jgi:putative Mg2+ transporter-C (MgtC) family protein
MFVWVEELLYNLRMSQFIAQNSEIILRLFLAVVLGMCVGAERLFMHKVAGMKTHALVSMGAALFILVSEEMAKKYINLPGFNPTIIASNIIVGIGFLGAGSIMLQGSHLLGVSTAGGLWVTAGIGMAAGFGLYGLAMISTVFVLFIFIAMSIIEKPLRKISREIDESRN